MRVAVVGAMGRMGQAVCDAVAASDDLDLAALVHPSRAGERSHGVDVSPDLDAITRSGAEVAVDFTNAAAATDVLGWCADHGVSAVSGTTGLAEGALDSLGARFEAAGAGLLWAPNFAIGAVLLMRFAEMAAPFFETAEVIELHHDAKADAPSGTALRTVERMAAASGEWGSDPTRTELVAGARGGEGPGGIRVHSVRLRGLVAHQEVLLGTTGQVLTIRHDSLDRTSFMPGVLLAVRAVADRPGLTVGLEPLLDL